MARPVEGVVLSGQIPLTEWDPDGETYVEFQRPRRFEAEQLAQMQAKSTLEWDSADVGTMRQRERVPLALLESAMVSMCLVGSNLTRVNDETGEEEPIFVPGKTCRAPKKLMPAKVESSFRKEWEELPDELAEEIVDKLREWHPPFNWRGGDSD